MAEEPSFTIRLGKIKNNRLLDRVQMVCDVFYEPKAKITKEMIKNKIARQFKKPNVVIFSAKKAFGGGRIRCFAMVYDSEDSMKKYESKKRLKFLRKNLMWKDIDIDLEGIKIKKMKMQEIIMKKKRKKKKRRKKKIKNHIIE